MISSCILAGELGRAGSRHEAFVKYETPLRAYIDGKQRGAERFSAALAPKTRWGLRFRNQVMKVPGLARLAVGSDIIDHLQLPAYDWPATNKG